MSGVDIFVPVRGARGPGWRNPSPGPRERRCFFVSRSTNLSRILTMSFRGTRRRLLGKKCTRNRDRSRVGLRRVDLSPMVETIEDRILLSDGLWLARLDGLPGDTPDEQIEA